MKKIFSIIGSIFLTLILIFTTITSISTISKGYTSFFNYSLVEVQSNSMAASNIYKDDVYIIEQKTDYTIGDIVAFRKDEQVWFHEIIEINDNYIVTKGSSNSFADSKTNKNDILGYKCSDINLKFINNIIFKISIIIIVYLIIMSIIISNVFSILDDENIPDSSGKKKPKKKKVKKIHSNQINCLLPILIFSILCVPALHVYSSSNQSVIVNCQNSISFVAKVNINFTYSDVKNGEITGYDNNCGESYVVIPSSDLNGNSVTSISDMVFFNNKSIKTLVIPETVVEIGWLNFLACTNLQNIVVKAENPITEWTSIFGLQINKNVNIYVPDKAIQTYKNADGWGKYKNQIHPLSLYKDN